MVCQTNGKGNCEQVGVTYEIECQRCKAVYVGETSRNAKKRGGEHLKELKEKRNTSVLWRHCKEEHAAEEQPFVMNVTGMYYNNPMERQIAESVKIRSKQQNNIKLINNKTEWNQFQIPELRIQ